MSDENQQFSTYSRSGVFSFLNFWSPPGEGSSSNPPPPPTEIPPNPKGFFANERTFLSWMQLCLVLGSLAIGLLNFGDSMAQISGLIFCTVAICMMFYALAQYHFRADKLLKKERGVFYEDWRGTILMVLFVFLAVIVNFILHFIYQTFFA